MKLTKEDEDKIRSRLYKLGYLGDEVHLDKNINYIVSGLERSGTSLMMQILNAAGVQIEYDQTRPPDKHNPNGYYELFGGKIINRLINNEVNMLTYKGKVIKVTLYGLKYLQKGKYKVIYMTRDIDEILDSMEKMSNVNETNRKETKQLLNKLIDDIEENVLEEDENINYIKINYNTLLKDPLSELLKVCRFLDIPEGNIKRMAMVIDQTLYKEKR